MPRDIPRETVFGRRLSRLAVACRQELDDLTLEVYCEALCYQTEPDEWDEFTLHAVRTGRFQWFPKVGEILDALREFRGAPSLLAEGALAYERVLTAGTYTAEAGRFWTYRDVQEKCGAAAAEAFLAAGGHNAFATTWEESKRREKFLSAYTDAVRDDPSAALRALPYGDGPKLLQSGEHEPTREEAGKILDRLRDMAGAETEAQEPVRVVASDERLEELKRQADQIIAATETA